MREQKDSIWREHGLFADDGLCEELRGGRFCSANANSDDGMGSLEGGFGV